MELLYSDILPLGITKGQETIAARIKTEISHANRVEIAVGYTSRVSLEELETLVEQNSNLKNITLTMGMYFVEGIPEGTYHAAVALNKKWQSAGIGEVRLVKVFKYHGKLYCFYNGERPVSAVIGSANMGVIKPDANNLRQYEICSITTDGEDCAEIAAFIERLKEPQCSQNISIVEGLTFIRETNVSLTGIGMVSRLPPTSIPLYMQRKTDVSFVLPIKVPAYDERLIDDGNHYTKSNINVCYAAPRSPRKPRDWYEVQMTVSKEITRRDGYPVRNTPFFVVTDDGYQFKVHTTSDGNKQFSAVGDELILGRWIKGRLAASGLVKPVNDTAADTNRLGMITKEVLTAYGCDCIVLTKTDQQAIDENGSLLDVWILSFEAAQN